MSRSFSWAYHSICHIDYTVILHDQILRHAEYGHIIRRDCFSGHGDQWSLVVYYNGNKIIIEESGDFYKIDTEFMNVGPSDDFQEMVRMYSKHFGCVHPEIITNTDSPGFDVYLKHMKPMQLKKAIISRGFYDINVICLDVDYGN